MLNKIADALKRIGLQYVKDEAAIIVDAPLESCYTTVVIAYNEKSHSCTFYSACPMRCEKSSSDVVLRFLNEKNKDYVFSKVFMMPDEMKVVSQTTLLLPENDSVNSESELERIVKLGMTVSLTSVNEIVPELLKIAHQH